MVEQYLEGLQRLLRDGGTVMPVLMVMAVLLWFFLTDRALTLRRAHLMAHVREPRELYFADLERDYGVVFTGLLEDDTLAVDHDATKRLRGKRTKGARSEPKASEVRSGGASL